MTESVEIEKLESYVGKKIRVKGIVNDIQDHGGLIFLEVSDLKSFAKALITPDKKDVYEMVRQVKKGYMIEITGFVKSSPVSAPHEGCELEVENLSIVSVRGKMANVISMANKKRSV